MIDVADPAQEAPLSERPHQGLDSEVTVEDVEKILGIDGLRQIAIHPRRQAACVIAFHRIRSHCHNWEVKPGRQLSLADDGGAF
jgi:hypothetical protein